VHCNKNSNLRAARDLDSEKDPWPHHAICPVERGTWLLRCQTPDCTKWYVGPPHRLCCDTCPRASDTTPGKRTRLRPPRGAA
jgi:hypothetical protein